MLDGFSPGLRLAKSTGVLFRICVVHVKLPLLEGLFVSGAKAKKLFVVDLSDECLRLTFPPPPRSARPLYSPLVIWWPKTFCSSQARAEWHADDNLLVVTVPTQPLGAAEGVAQTFENVLMDEVF